MIDFLHKPLLEHDADIHAVDENNNTPLHAAAGKGYSDTVALLIERKAEVNAKNLAGVTPLHSAIFYSCNIEVVMRCKLKMRSS